MNTISMSLDDFNNVWNPAVREIARVLTDHFYGVRIIGGAVRDLLRGHHPRDIDLVTDAGVESMIFLFGEQDMTIDVTGIQHGTVKVTGSDNVVYEITSLDIWLEAENRDPVTNVNDPTRPGGPWYLDAKDRDFTIDAMSIDDRGTLYDYFDGQGDLSRSLVRPVGDWDVNIKRKPVVALRYFRMLSKFESPRWRRHDVDLIEANLSKLDGISKHRRWLELSGILTGPGLPKVWPLIESSGVARIFESAGGIESDRTYTDIDPVAILGWSLSRSGLLKYAKDAEWTNDQILHARWISQRREENKFHTWRWIQHGIDPNWVLDFLRLDGQTELADEILNMKVSKIFDLSDKI